MLKTILVFLFLSLAVNLAKGDECCKRYQDLDGSWNDKLSCSTYCCKSYHSWFSTYLYCCTTNANRADSSDIADDCYDTDTTFWWLYNSKWVIAVGSVGTVVTLIIVCVCCCIRSRRNRPTAVVVGPGGNVMAMTQMSQSSQNQGAQYPPGNFGNPPPQYPGPQYPSGSYGQQPPPVNGTYPAKPLPKNISSRCLLL